MENGNGQILCFVNKRFDSVNKSLSASK